MTLTDNCPICDSELEDGVYLDYWLGYDQDFEILADALAVEEGIYAHPDEHEEHYIDHLGEPIFDISE